MDAAAVRVLFACGRARPMLSFGARILISLSMSFCHQSRRKKTKSIYVRTRAILSWNTSCLYMSVKFENAEATFLQIVFMFLSECNNTNWSLLKIYQNNGKINIWWSFHLKRHKEYSVDIAFLEGYYFRVIPLSLFGCIFGILNLDEESEIWYH